MLMSGAEMPNHLRVFGWRYRQDWPLFAQASDSAECFRKLSEHSEDSEMADLIGFCKTTALSKLQQFDDSVFRPDG